MKNPIYQIDIVEPGIYISDYLDTGLHPILENMSYIGEIAPGTVIVNKEDDTTADLFNQETKDIALSVLSAIGVVNLVFETRNINTDNLLLAFGGTVTSEGEWFEPVKYFAGRKKALAIISKAEKGKHTVTYFALMKVTAKKTGTFAEDETNNIQFSCKKLEPVNETTGVKQSAKQIQIVPAAADNPITNDSASTFGWDYVESFKNATDYEYSTDGGTIFADCTANPQTGITGAVPVGDLLVRVKAVIVGDNRNSAGFVLANTEPFTV